MVRPIARPFGHVGRGRAWGSACTLASALACALVPLASLPLHAQSRYSLSPFASMNGSLDGTPALVGAALTTYGSSLGGILGMRFGGAYDVRALGGTTASAATERGWVADVDAVISPARLPVIGPMLGGFLPTLFSGIGVEGVRRDAGESGQSVVTSYGAGVSRSLGGALAIETEARRRIPVSWSGASSDATATTRRGWEYRLGISIGFGGRSTPAGRIPGIPLPGGSRSSTRVEPAPTAPASAVIATGDDYVGTRYTYGGTTPQSGFDCSGFVQFVFRRNGVTLPRTSRQQSTAGRSLPAGVAGLRAGDLLFFSQRGDVVDHVAIYAGGNRILHSTSSGGGVRYDDLGSARGKWFTDRLVATRRVLGAGSTFVDPTVASAVTVTLDPPDLAPKPN
jgi:cell wall-associated NlpC family hydrolase